MGPTHRTRFCALGIVAATAAVIALFTWISTRLDARMYVLSPETDYRQPLKLSSYSGHIRIISWTKMFGSQRGPWFTEGTSAFENCELPSGATCEYTNDKSQYESSDAVLFVGNLLSMKSMPKTLRNPAQIWIFAQHESPVRTWSYAPAELSKFARSFNVSSTYSRKSNVAFNYGSCEEKSDEDKLRTELSSVRNYAANKTELVAWFVSHCDTPSKREKYVSELQKFIPVHVYGKCGPLKCSKEMEECDRDLLQRKYKFYLAFENSICEDYITEKFWKCFELGIIPVVYGGADYLSFAPAHSFIDVKDFKSPKLLAEHLHLLAENDQLYNGYFTWKDSHHCQQYNYTQYPCLLCQSLHERVRSGRTFPPLDLNKMWSKSHCTKPDEFRKKCNCWPSR